MIRPSKNLLRIVILIVMVMPILAMNSRSANSYQGIVAGNVFRLKQPAIAPDPVIPVALPELRLIGVTTITGDKRALLRIRFPATPDQVVREELVWFKEQQRSGTIAVMEIDEVAGAIRATVSGTSVLARIDAESKHQDNPPLPAHSPPAPPP